MKNHALLIVLVCVLSHSLPARGGTVYRPGLWQASLSGSGNWTGDILSASNVERVPGTMMAEVTGSTNSPITGTTFTWGGNQTWGYAGQMYMRAGVTYHFYKYVDDNGNYVVDGTTILNNHTTYNAFAHASHTPTTSGWKNVDLRFGNAGGGAGRSGLFGAGWNTNGVSASQLEGWEHIADPGDCSLLRVATGESFSSADTADMIIGASGLSLALSHEDLPAGATLYALLDAADRGTDLMADWASVENLGAVPSGTGEEYYVVASAIPSGVMRLALMSPGTSADAFVEWLDPVDLSSVARDGALTLGATIATDYDAIDVSVIVPSLGPAESVALKVELSTTSDFSSGALTKNLSPATAAGATSSVHFGSRPPDTAHWVRVTATPDVGDPIVKVYEIATKHPGPVFSASVDTGHVAPQISLSFTSPGFGASVTKITVQAATSATFSYPEASRVFPVNLSAMPTNVNDIVVPRLPDSSPVYFRIIAENSGGYTRTVDLSESPAIASGDNAWSGLSENIADMNAYLYAGGMPSAGNKLFFALPAGLSPIIDQDRTMPSLRFTSKTTEAVDTGYLGGYHSCGYDLTGTGVLTFSAEKPILQASKGTNVVRNPILFSRNNSQTVYVTSQNGRLDLTGELMLPDNVSNTTMRVNGDGGEVHFGGPSTDFMGTLFLETSFTLSLDHPNAMTNVSRIFFDGGWGSFTYLKNNTGAPMTFPRCTKVEATKGWSSSRACFRGAPMLFPEATLIWYVRAFDGSTFDADVFVKDLEVGKNDNGGDAGLDKRGTGTLAVSGTTSWSAQNVKHYIRLRGGCFWPQTTAGLPPSGEFYVPVKNEYGTLGLSGDYSPMLDGSSTPRVFQETSESVWGFTGFGGDRVVCWNADPALNLTNTTSHNVSIKLADASSVSVGGKTFDAYYAYPSRLMFGNRSEFADGTVIFRNPIRYELNQNWDTATYFESTNHVVAARMRGSLKLGNRDKTWNFSGRNFGGYLALEAENTDFTGKVNVHEKGNLLVNSSLVARSATVQSGSGLGGTGSLSTEDGTTVKSGGSLFGGEWNKGGVLTLGGKVTLEGGSALRAEVGASSDRIGCAKLAAGSTLKLTAPVYVDVDTDPRVSPVRGASCKILDWSEASFDSGSAPKREDFVARPESNSDIRSIYVVVRDDGLYVNYISVRCPPSTIMILR